MLVKGSEAIVFVKSMAGKAWVSGAVIASEESGEVVVISHKWYLGNCPRKTITGRALDEIDGFRMSCVDVGNPCIFVQAL